MPARPERPRHDTANRDRQFARRLAISFAAAIALHEIVAGFFPPAEVRQAPETVVAQQIVTLTKRAKPSPTPRPTPRITPRPRATVAPQIAVRAPAPKAAATPHAAIGGAAARRRIVLVTPRPIPPSAAPILVATGTQAGQQNGGSGTGAGAGNGTSGLAGAGTGAGSSGNGNGGDANTACGQVDLLPGRVEYRPDGTVLRYVIARVTTPSDVLVGRFPYPFIYPAQRLDPFSNDDVRLLEAGGVPVQLPPPDFDQSTLLPAVAFVLKYTNPANGHTTLPPCPGSGS